MKIRELLAAFVLPQLLLGLGAVLTAGCNDKETLLEVDTPRGGVEVERDRDTGEVDVDANPDDKVIDVDTPGADVEVTRDPDNGGVDVNVDEE
jgi:hypothetical protein